MHVRHGLIRLPIVCQVLGVTALVGLFTIPPSLFAEESLGIKPLHHIHLSQIQQLLPTGTRVLIEAEAIERFLSELDGAPPDWGTVYGHGHGDAGHDERLFQLNRDRDTKRAGKDALNWLVAFVWSGELSTYDPESGGFHVVLGPELTSTSWGLVRFKYEDLFGNLIALPPSPQRKALQEEIGPDRSRKIDVVMLGTLIPEESIVYDFSHDEEGRGMVMPVVRIRDIFYLRAPSRMVP